MNDPQTADELQTVSSRIVRKCSCFLHNQSSPTVLIDCRRKLFHLWARLEREGSINEITPLNRAELRERVVFFTLS